MAASGAPWSMDRLQALVDAAGPVPIHMDGARLFNAEVATGIDAAAWADPVDDGHVLPVEGPVRARGLAAGRPRGRDRRGAPGPQAPGRGHAAGGRAGGARAAGPPRHGRPPGRGPRPGGAPGGGGGRALARRRARPVVGPHQHRGLLPPRAGEAAGPPGGAGRPGPRHRARGRALRHAPRHRRRRRQRAPSTHWRRHREGPHRYQRGRGGPGARGHGGVGAGPRRHRLRLALAARDPARGRAPTRWWGWPGWRAPARASRSARPCCCPDATWSGWPRRWRRSTCCRAATSS